MQSIFENRRMLQEAKAVPGGSVEEDFMYGSNVATAHVYVRMGFLRKVYGILSVQLLITTVICGLMMFQKDEIKTYLHAHPWPVFLGLVLSIGLLVALYIKKRETPINYILLLAFTVVESLTIGIVVVHYSVALVLQAFFLTTGVTVGLTLYTLQSKRDFSNWGAALFACLWILLLAGILQIFIPSPILHLCASVGGAIIFSMLIIFDTSMIMHRVSPEDYIQACIDLYLDIINLFLYILRILAELNKNN